MDNCPLRYALKEFESGSRPKGGVSGIKEGIPSLGGEHLNKNGGFRFETIKYVPVSFADSMTRGHLKPNDILVVKDGATTGKVSIVRSDFPYKRAVINEHLFRLEANERFIPEYIFYYLYSQKGQQEILSDFRGAAQGGISQGFLDKVSIPNNSLQKQRDIVAEIEKQFTRLEAGVGALKRVQASLNRYRTAVLKAACEGKLVPTEAELAEAEGRSYETGEQLLQRILKERRKNWTGRGKYKEPAGRDSDILQAIPEGWNVCSIGQISECLDAKRVPINKKERANRNGDIPYYGANGQVGWIDDFLFDEPLVLIVEDETFTGRTQPFCYLIRGKSWVNNHAHVIRASGAVLTAYLNYSLSYYPFTARTTGSTGRRKLTQKALIGAPYLLPPLAEQKRIVQELERRLSIIEELESTVSTNLQRSTRLRQSILQNAFVCEF